MSSMVVFYRDSPKAEVSRVIKEAGASESHFYGEPQSTEACIRAFLEDRDDLWIRWIQNEIEARYEASGGGLEVIVDALLAWFEDSQLHGATLKVMVSNRGFSEQNFEIARKPKEQLRRFVEQLFVKMGIRHPDIGAVAAVQIIERTIAMILTRSDLSELKTAQLLFRCLQNGLSLDCT